MNSIRSAAADLMNNAQWFIGRFVKWRGKCDKCIAVLKALYLVTSQKAMFWFARILIFCFCYQSTDQGNPWEFRMPSTSQPLTKGVALVLPESKPVPRPHLWICPQKDIFLIYYKVRVSFPFHRVSRFSVWASLFWFDCLSLGLAYIGLEVTESKSD